MKTKQQLIHDYHVELGSRGGYARAAALTPKQRSEIAARASHVAAIGRTAKAKARKAAASPDFPLSQQE